MSGLHGLRIDEADEKKLLELNSVRAESKAAETDNSVPEEPKASKTEDNFSIRIDEDFNREMARVVALNESCMHHNAFHAVVMDDVSAIVFDTSTVEKAPLPAKVNDQLPERYRLTGASYLQAAVDLLEIVDLKDGRSKDGRSKDIVKKNLVTSYNEFVRVLDGTKDKLGLLAAFIQKLESSIKSYRPSADKEFGFKWFEAKGKFYPKGSRKKSHILTQLRQFARCHVGVKPLIFKRGDGVVELLRPIRANGPYTAKESAPEWVKKLVEKGNDKRDPFDLSVLPTQVLEKWVDGASLRNAWAVTIAKEKDDGFDILARYTRSGGISTYNETLDEKRDKVADGKDLLRAETLDNFNKKMDYQTALMSLMSPGTNLVTKLRNEYPRTESMRLVAKDKEWLMNESPIYSKGGNFPDEIFNHVAKKYVDVTNGERTNLGALLRMENMTDTKAMSWQGAYISAKCYVDSFKNGKEKQKAELLLAWKALDINKHARKVVIPTVVDQLALANKGKAYHFEWQQAIDVVLGHLNGISVNIQCKSGKDRTGLIAMMVSMLTQSMAKNGSYFPLETDKAGQFKAACKEAADSGVASFVAHYTGTFGCAGMMKGGGLGTKLTEMVCPSISDIVKPQLSEYAAKHRAGIDLSKAASSSVVSSRSSSPVSTDAGSPSSSQTPFRQRAGAGAGGPPPRSDSDPGKGF